MKIEKVIIIDGYMFRRNLDGYIEVWDIAGNEFRTKAVGIVGDKEFKKISKELYEKENKEWSKDLGRGFPFMYEDNE
jgi:hypothetical protein